MLDEQLLTAIRVATETRFNDIKRAVDSQYPEAGCVVEFHRRELSISWALSMCADRDEDELSAAVELFSSSSGWGMKGNILLGATFLRELEAVDVSVGSEALLSLIDEFFVDAEDVLLPELAIQHPRP